MGSERKRGPVPGDHALWDTNDVAAYLKVSRSWVYHQAEAGLLPHMRIGALLRFDPAVIREFALGRAHKPAEPIPVARKPTDERP